MATSPSTVSLDARGKRILSNVDWISTLPDDLLLIILMKMPTERAIQTSVLSTRWKSVWKLMPCLVFDLRGMVRTREESLAGRLEYLSTLITKVINNHNGNLEYCRIHSLVRNYDNVLQTWIRSLIHVKGTKSLAILNHFQLLGARRLHLLPNTFSHPALTSLHLYHFRFETPHAFNNCQNLLILKLGRICAKPSTVFNTIIAACTSLKVLVIENTMRDSEIGCLKIHNNSLKLLHVASFSIYCIDVSAPLLDILSIRRTCDRRVKVILTAPRLLKVNEKYCAVKEKVLNISCNAQEEESIEHKYLLSRESNYLEMFKSLTVIVDIMNPREVEMLREVLGAWNGIMKELEIVFKQNNNPRKEEGGTQMTKWEEAKPFPNVDFRVKVLRMFNFNGSETNQFELASRFVTQGTVMEKMMIKTSSVVPASKKLEIEAAVAKLMQLPKGNEELSIECF